MLLRSQPAAHLSKKLHRAERILAADTSVPSGHTRTHTSAQMSISSSLPHFGQRIGQVLDTVSVEVILSSPFVVCVSYAKRKRQGGQAGRSPAGKPATRTPDLIRGNGAGGPARPARLQRHNWQRRKGRRHGQGLGTGQYWRRPCRSGLFRKNGRCAPYCFPGKSGDIWRWPF